MKTETIPFRDFMDGSYKKPQSVISYSFVPVGGLVMNEPTAFLLTTIGIGMVAIILEQIAENKSDPRLESIRKFRSFHNRFVVPSSVIGIGVYLFVGLCKTFL
jgi:hypothetical protein